jgi:site-specific DNA recombinase
MARTARGAAKATRGRPSEPDATRRAVIYCRVSTAEQAESGLGLDSQERRCRSYCDAQGWEVKGVFIDAGASAKDLDRPELDRALSALSPGDMLVILKLDRMTRVVSHLAPLLSRISAAGADWVTVQEHYDTSTATGRLMLRLMLELSHWEREVIGERTAAALAEKRARKERLGRLPLGWRVDSSGNLAPDPEEMATVERVRALRAEGKSYRAIARELDREGRRTQKGGAWAPETIRKILSPRYVETIAQTAAA